MRLHPSQRQNSSAFWLSRPGDLALGVDTAPVPRRSAVTHAVPERQAVGLHLVPIGVEGAELVEAELV